MDSEPQKVLTPLEESKAVIVRAREDIANELSKNKKMNKHYRNKWFYTFISVASTVHGFFELAQMQKQITGEELERAKVKDEKLFAKIEEIRGEDDKGLLKDVSEETKEELLGMLDIYKK